MGRHKNTWPEKDEKQEEQYVTVSMISNRLGHSRAMVRGAIERGELSGVKATSNYNSSGFEWNVLLEDAEAYISKKLAGKLALENEEEEVEGETLLPASEKLALENEKLVLVYTLPLGAPDECGSCGTGTGNILGDVDDHSEQYGYLCFRCYKLVQMFHGDTLRMEKVLTYLHRTRG